MNPEPIQTHQTGSTVLVERSAEKERIKKLVKSFVQEARYGIELEVSDGDGKVVHPAVFLLDRCLEVRVAGVSNQSFEIQNQTTKTSALYNLRSVSSIRRGYEIVALRKSLQHQAIQLDMIDAPSLVLLVDNVGLFEKFYSSLSVLRFFITSER